MTLSNDTMTSHDRKVNRPATGEVNLAGRVRSARERLGWSRETLAHHAGLSWAAISQIEAGRRTAVRAGTLDALAQALGVTTDHLLAREPEKELLAHGALMYESAEDLLG